MPILIADTRGVLRSGMEYPTVDVTFAYLGIIDKLTSEENPNPYWFPILTVDSFADKSIQYYGFPDYAQSFARWADKDNYYTMLISTGAATADFRLRKRVNGSVTTLATESVDLSTVVYLLKLSCSGSTISAFRSDMATPKLSVTDTDLASGKFGVVLVDDRTYKNADIALTWLRAPSSPPPRARVIVEAEVVGSGSEEDPFRPDLAQLPDEHPEFGCTDRLSVTWEAFDHKLGHSTVLVVVTSGNPYTGDEAVQAQVERARSRNLKVLKPPRDYVEAVEQYRALRRDFPEWLAGKDNYAYQVLGHRDLEAFQVADAYYGNIVDGAKPNAYKGVPDWEMRRALQMWMERLRRAEIVRQEAEKHLRKLEEVLRVGW